MTGSATRVDRGVEYRLAGDPQDWRPCPRVAERFLRSFGAEALRIRRHVRKSPPSASLVFAGPWIGEFGWELLRFQGVVRAAARATPTGRFIVMGDPGHGVLYEGAAEFWETPAFFRKAGFTRQCDHIRTRYVRARDHFALLGRLIHDEIEKQRAEIVSRIEPRKFPLDGQGWRKLAVNDNRWSSGLGRDYVCVVPRLRAWNAEKNMPPEWWHKLIGHVTGRKLSAAVVAAPEEVAQISPGLEIESQHSLARSIDLLSHARLAIAGESGGAVLSLMCGAPTLVFGRQKWERLICEEFNPLSTRVKYLVTPDFKLTAEEVADAARELL